MTDTTGPAHTGSAAGFDYTAYLLAKIGVDDAALSQEVFDVFASAPMRSPGDAGATWIEFGAGLGTMVVRLLRWLPSELSKVLHGGRYFMVDADPGFAERARSFLNAELSRMGYVHEDCDGDGDGEGAVAGLRVGLPQGEETAWLELQFVEREALAWLGEVAAGELRADRILAHTFVDLVDTASFLTALWPCTNPCAWFWFSSVYEGVTQLHPPHEHDNEVWKAYNGSMQVRGGPRHASELRRELVSQGARIARQEPADWEVRLSPAGESMAPAARHGAAAAFVGFILDTVGREAAVQAALGPTALQCWLQARRAGLAEGQLSFRAHQLDFVGCAPAFE